MARTRSFFKYLFGVMYHSEILHDITICYVISTPLTTGLAGLWIKWRHKIRFIFEVGDLWPEAPIQLGYIKNYFLKKALYKLEKLIYQQSESVVALSPRIRNAIEEKLPDKKIVVITNISDVDFYCQESKSEVLLRKYDVREKFVISYIGTLGFANGLEYFLECAHACQQADLTIQFILCGEGAMLQVLKQRAQRLNLQNFLLVPFQNRHGVREILNVSDAVFVCYRHVSILETGSPNKYFDGLASGKLIIMNFGGWIKEEVENNQCGIFLDPKHPSDIVQKIDPFLQQRELLLQFQRNARQLAETTYSRKIIGEKIFTLFAETVK